ncbi:MAG: MBL fold metallo-hydrolase [Minwuia sp.]|nr:MBL fold metallo-hydrolase [Minwuia sp.]
MTTPTVEGFYDTDTNTLTYLVHDPATRDAVIIDPVMAFDPVTVQLDPKPAMVVMHRARVLGLRVVMVLETHLHADHVSAAPWVGTALDAPVGIGAGVSRSQKIFADLFDAEPEFRTDGSQFDRLFEDGETFQMGEITVRIMATPGHTPGCVTYVIGDAAFVGDCLFMPDFGSARCDFPGGDARALYRSVSRILDLPPDTRLFTAHDYQPGGRELRFEASVAEQRASNLHMRDGVDEDAFVAMRRTRDAGLSTPRLMLPSVQLNMRAGGLPPPAANGRRYLRLPLAVTPPPEGAI